MPPEPSSPNPSLRTGVHDLRNVLNAVQLNAFAARQLVDDATRTLACIARIEAAVQRGTGVLQAMPAEETLATAGAVLQERLRDAGGSAEVRCDGAQDAAVPGLLRQALCLVAVESQALGAQSFALSCEGGDAPSVRCEVEGLRAPGPVAMALVGTDIAPLRVEAEPLPGGWAFRWTIDTTA